MPGNAQQAFLTAPDGGSMTSLGTLGGAESSANSLNALGQVVGVADRSVVVGGPLPHAFRTGSQSQGMFDLGALNPAGGSEALDINIWGQVAGWSQPASNGGVRHAIFTDRNGVMKDLGTLGGPNAQAHGINALGQMVGYSSTSNGSTHAFITRPNPIANPDGGNLTDVGTLGGAHSFAYHINDRGTLVGSAFIASGSSCAMRSSCGTRLDNLNTLVNPASGWTLVEALGNNNAGQIVGYGSYQGHTRAFLLNPVVPASITLSSTNVIGSNAVTATVLLNKPAPVDMDIPLFFRTLMPGNPGCYFGVVGISTPPAWLHFSAGQTSAALTIITIPVSQDNRLTFSVASEAGDFSASLDIRKPRLTSITFNTNSVTGGQDIQINGTVNLDGPLPQDESLVIALYSDPTPGGLAINSDGWIYDSMTDGRVNLSPGIDISRGRQSADFSITVPSVNMPTDVNVGGYIRYAQQWSVFSDGTARFIGYTNYPSSPGETGASKVLHVHSPSIDVLRPRFSSSHRFPGGTALEMLLALNVAAFPSDATVTLSASSPAASLPDPAVARVPAGNSYVAFPLSLGVVLSETPVTLTASLGGNSTSYQLVILPNGPSALLLSPAEAAGGLVPVSGVVRLYNPAEPGGATVSLTSDSPLATVPSSVVVPGNATYVSFPIQTQPVAARTVVHLSASRYDQTQTAALTLDPVGPATLSFNPPSLVGGKRPATGTVALNAPAQPGGVLVTLTCDNPRVSIPGSVTVPEGLMSADFPVLVPSVTNTTQVSISASRLDQSVSNALTILPIRTVQLTGYVSIASNDVSTVEDMDVLVKPGAIVTFSGHHYLNSLAVEGTVTHPTADTNGLNLDITDLLDIRAGGSLDVSGRGFRGGYSDGNPSGNAETNSVGGSATGNAGGSYGSAGFTQAGDISNPLYGSELKPLDLGSGGASTSSFNRGGNGGGRILIETGNFMNNGTVSADGGASFSYAGGGSGGSIHIHVRGGYVKGNGYGHAQGGWSPYAYYSGGHGRIAVTGYLSNDFTGIVGPAGTIYLQYGEAPGELVVIATTLTIPKDTTKTYQRIYAVGPPSTVVNQGILALVTNHLLITNMTLVQDGVILNPDRNDNSLGMVTVGTGGLITHSHGSTRGLSLKVAGTLTVLGDGRIDVSGMGFRGGYRDVNPSGTGETRSPDGSATVVGGASGRSGGSYGSLGTPAGGGTPNAIYGLSNAPAELGSGGGADLPIHPGGNGGGRVDLEAQNVVLLGQILADGAGGSSSLSGGSGGAIWLRLHGGQFTGSGALYARGSAASGDAGSGGGGRIAITGFTNNSFSGSVSPGSGSLFALSAQPPAIIQQPLSQKVAIGDPVSFHATASGDAPLFYQWRKDGAPIAGQTNDTFTLAGAQTSDAGAYSVLISNIVKAIVSDSAQLTVQPPTVALSSWGLVSPTRFKLLVEGTPGRLCVVETSTNLADWTPLLTNTLSATAWEFNDLNVSNAPSRFYRARLLR
ncbi:MAG: immunoglobulin domain-containing protein [Verrucomicrobia bacterium]|nr:immunoglobulin domain-containing protein [Verrucomicrobiota bacterium]